MSTHQEKQRIFDEYAKKFMAPDFNHLMFWSAGKNRLEHIFAACDLVQEEQQKRIAENARIKIIYAEKDEFVDTPIELGPVVDKNTIINPENKIQ